ncbi:unnamed protein product, partial [marine sediment metagenome]
LDNQGVTNKGSIPSFSAFNFYMGERRIII